MSTIPLGHIHPIGAPPQDPCGRLLHLPHRQMVVMMLFPSKYSYVCAVAASTAARPADQPLVLTLYEVDTAPSVLSVEQLTDPDIYTLLWLTRVAQRATPTAAHARALAERARRPGTRTLTPHEHLGFNQDAVAASLRNLVDRGLLATTDNGRSVNPVYELTVPYPAVTCLQRHPVQLERGWRRWGRRRGARP